MSRMLLPFQSQNNRKLVDAEPEESSHLKRKARHIKLRELPIVGNTPDRYYDNSEDIYS